MRFEVEQKHRIEDAAQFAVQLTALGVKLGAPVEQSDRYFAHPCRDFAITDEALRIRTVGGKSFVTYKGPKLDTTTKTRQEVELPLDPSDADGSQFSELLMLLGFVSVAVVRKTRHPFQLPHEGALVEGALDAVEGLGTFVELEVTADDAGLERAKRVVAAIAARFALAASERRSYLEMLLEKQGKGNN